MYQREWKIVRESEKLRKRGAPGAPGTCECFYRNRYRYR